MGRAKDDPANVPEPLGLILNSLERCDSRACGSQARVRVYLRSFNYLQFCKHHADDQPDSLFADAEYVLNESKYILENP